MKGEQANLLINAFYDSIVARERDEAATLNIGLHQLTIRQCGLDLYVNLVNKEEFKALMDLCDDADGFSTGRTA